MAHRTVETSLYRAFPSSGYFYRFITIEATHPLIYHVFLARDNETPKRIGEYASQLDAQQGIEATAKEFDLAFMFTFDLKPLDWTIE